MNTFRRLGTAAALCASLGLLSACSSNDPITAGPNKKPSHHKTATGPAKHNDKSTITIDKKGTHWCASIKAADFKATGQYSAEQVADAYCEMITFNGENFLTNFAEAQPKGEWSPNADLFVRDYLTNSAWKDFDSDYQSAIKKQTDQWDLGSTEESDRIFGLAAFSIETKEYQFVKDQPYAGKRRWSPAEYWIDNEKRDSETGSERLGMKIVFDDDLLMRKDDKRVTLPLHRNWTVWLSPSGGGDNGDHHWLIDGWELDWKFGEPR